MSLQSWADKAHAGSGMPGREAEALAAMIVAKPMAYRIEVLQALALAPIGGMTQLHRGRCLPALADIAALATDGDFVEEMQSLARPLKAMSLIEAHRVLAARMLLHTIGVLQSDPKALGLPCEIFPQLFDA